MRDVARAAGVSVATVSRVLTGADRVATDKREAVLRACKELRYQPDGVAAALRSRSTSSVGILVPDITNPYFPAVVQAAEHELAKFALDLVFCDADNDVSIEAQRLNTLLRRRVDALLVCPVHTKGSVSALRAAARSVRLVQLDRHAIDEADFVGVDEAAGINQVVEHLRAEGATDAVFVGVYPDMSSIVERADTFQTACDRLGVRVRSAVELPFPDVANGRAYAREALAGKDLPAAIVCANDELAFGVLQELRTAGVRCPEDVMVTGYDDVPAAELLGLTTVRQPLPELGREAARLLHHESSVPRHVRLTPTLVARETTAAAAGCDGRPA